MIPARSVLVVDAANVIGSWPDGWWRDRHAAVERLRDSLASLGDDQDVILVVEGQAQRVAPIERVDVVATQGSGDDEIVRVAATMASNGRQVIVATADRELRSRLAAVGADAIGPKALPYKGR